MGKLEDIAEARAVQDYKEIKGKEPEKSSSQDAKFINTQAKVHREIMERNIKARQFGYKKIWGE